MLCKGCGKEIANDSLYCPNCGFKNEPTGMSGNPQNDIPTQQGQNGQSNMPQQGFGGPGNVPLQGFGGPGNVPPQQSYGRPGNVPPQQGWGSGSVPPQGFGGPGNVPPQGFGGPGNVPPQQNWGGYGNVPPQGFGGPGNVPPQQGFGRPGNVPPQQGFGGPGNIPPMGPNMLPPNMGYMPDQGKKKSKILIPIIAIAAFVIVTVVLIIVIPKIVNKNDGSKESANEENDDLFNNDITPTPDVTTSPTPETIATVEPTQAPPADPLDGVSYSDMYTYTELPNTSSLDSYSNFSYYDNTTDQGISTYQFVFLGDTTGDQFTATLDSYGSILEGVYGYTYEQDISDEGASSSGDYTAYYTLDDNCILITADSSASSAYVSIMSISGDSGENGEESFPNYLAYVDGRDTVEIDFGTEYQMENTVAFYVNNVYSNQQDDGSVSIDAQLSLASGYDGSYVAPYDFMVLPYDTDGNVLGDAVPISSITDTDGYDVSMPLTLDSTYRDYDLTFYVPAGTTYISFYATNALTEGFAGALYTMDITFEQ